jgi:hypothetical protein
MSRIVATITVLAAAAALAAGLAAGRPAATAAKPKLRVLTEVPFVVVGSGFRGGENVQVTVRGKTRRASKTDKASTTGRIHVRFLRMPLGRCPFYVVAARGDRGSRAGLRSIPRVCGIDPRPVP